MYLALCMKTIDYIFYSYITLINKNNIAFLIKLIIEDTYTEIKKKHD